MRRLRAVPFWPTLIGLALILGAAVTCRKQVGEVVNDAALWETADGRPLDNAGDGLRCPDCEGGILWWRQGYEYHCNKCGRTLRARYHFDTVVIEYDW